MVASVFGLYSASPSGKHSAQSHMEEQSFFVSYQEMAEFKEEVIDTAGALSYYGPYRSDIKAS